MILTRKQFLRLIGLLPVGVTVSFSEFLFSRFPDAKVMKTEGGQGYLVILGDADYKDVELFCEESRKFYDEIGFDYKKMPISFLFNVGKAEVIKL